MSMTNTITLSQFKLFFSQATTSFTETTYPFISTQNQTIIRWIKLNPIRKVKQFVADKTGFTQVLIAIVIVIVADGKKLFSLRQSHHDHGSRRSPIVIWHSHKQRIRTILSSQHHNNISSDIRLRGTSIAHGCNLCIGVALETTPQNSGRGNYRCSYGHLRLYPNAPRVV